MKEETRKCSICKSFIYINKDNQEFIIDDNKYIHTKCFTEYKTNLKRGAWTQEECIQYIDALKIKTKQEVQLRTIRKKVTDWIFVTYNVSFLPTFFYTKLDQIYTGAYKGLSKSIPPEDLLDMWQRKIGYLDKVNIRNKSNGKVLDGNSRINYDLAIILSKYDSYLEWKEEQKIIKNGIQKSIQDNKQKINYNNIGNKQIKEDESIDINSIVDDI